MNLISIKKSVKPLSFVICLMPAMVYAESPIETGLPLATQRLMCVVATATNKTALEMLPKNLATVHLTRMNRSGFLSELSPKERQYLLCDDVATVKNDINNRCFNWSDDFSQQLGDAAFREILRIATHEKRPILFIANMIRALFYNTDTNLVHPNVERVCEFLSLIEEFADHRILDRKNHSREVKPLYYFFDKWEHLMEGENLSPSLKKIHNFLQKNKTVRLQSTLMKNFYSEFAQELNNPWDFLDNIIIGLLELDPEQPIALCVDKVAASLMDSDGQIKPGFADIHTFLLNIRTIKDVKALYRSLAANITSLFKPLINRTVIGQSSSTYDQQLAQIADRFKKDYPIFELPRVLSERIIANNAFFKANPSLVAQKK
jgi:hypothetical protein